MGALLSIPVLSYLLIPSMSSYGTSLNLIFFYLTWTTLVLSHGPLKVELVGTTAVRLIFYFIPSVLFFLFDILIPSASVVLKVYGKDGLPQGKKKKYGTSELKVAGWAIFNLILSIAAQGLIEFVLTRVLGLKSRLKVTTKLPLPWDIIKGVGRALILREILQYFVHRHVLHSWTPFQRHHNDWYHSIHTPYPLTAHYDHPVVYILWRFLPVFLPAAAFRCHLLTYMLYLSIVSLEETFAHSGYKPMPTSFFIGGIARRIDQHLLHGGHGNYAPLGVMDWLFGTSIGDELEDDIPEQSNRESIAEKLVEKKPRRSHRRRTRESVH
ncbi:sterol desaturase [Nannizzia gypsea CBS 118893]|uniref:Sterol desaturase n=1 Tax=Arthroderma gypseum (strain ATCC MYA-4604 / CBS 118893) TaxID=535722 RepID=E4UTI2_ARTGP|nr:sterol desaturase [Nannizzia gypsea CBS 118893]EFR01527.1 sterol desaturase [Nannizzia gypsea CBS 118893]